MLCPKVVGQSGTASAAPVFVTRPPNTISTSVAAAVTRARRYVTRCTAAGRSSVPSRSRGSALLRRRRLRQPVFRRFGRAVLVRPPVDGRPCRPPVAVRRRRGRRPLQRVAVPRVQGRLLAREDAPDEVHEERDLAEAEPDGPDGDEDVPVLE